MKFNKTLIGSVISMTLASSVTVTVNAQEVTGNTDLLQQARIAPQAVQKGSSIYIVQLKGQTAIAKAADLGELMPSNQLVSTGNRYNGNSANIQAYTAAQTARQNALAQEVGAADVLYNYIHTFNGFSAKMSPSQAAALENHPDVAGIWEDEAQQPTTSNTPDFLGLNSPAGQHALDIKGDGVVIGILDTGITPENPSFSGDGFSDPATALPGWTGTCDPGEEAGAGESGEDTFQCNNKLIGARYFGIAFAETHDIQYVLGEFDSPRDADGHGSHTAGTAAGNEGVTAIMQGFDIGTMSGMAPEARIAAYKVCWNSDYVSPEGVDERGCFFGDSMAAIDQAVLDGVDVLNYSIGNSLDLTTPVYRASLDAALAGVFFAGSAGNSGPGPETTSNTAPWVTTVAASTYDGTSALVGDALLVTTDGGEPEALFSIHGEVSAPVPAEGFSGELAAAQPALACDPITNPEALAGKVALIARGTCNFNVKIENAEAAGATGVVVYSDSRTPIAMGGSASTPITIPAVMVQNTDGLDLDAALTSGSSISIAMTHTLATGEATEVGNVMAGFSSRGANLSSEDIIKPDITAPGVRILAATTDTPMFGSSGEQVRYLQGTSMSSPHIAGLAALLMGENGDWTPAQVKSAMMTTARQNVLKEDGLTPADPFDFGGGHVAPVTAQNPGLTYEANYKDYLAFMCGIGEEDFVAGQGGDDCAQLTADGFATDPSQLNYPSIGIADLLTDETITRTVTDVSGAGGTYTATIDAPAGISVSLATFDSEGTETEGDELVVPADGKASYALTFRRQEGFVPNEWTFGSIIWSDGTHSVRSPIAIRPRPDIDIVVPESLSLTLNRGRASFPVQMLYTGNTSMSHAGLVAPFGSARTVFQDPDSTFGFNEDELGTHFFLIPEGTQVARFSLRDALVSNPGADLDLYVYRCDEWFCTQLDTSTAGGSNEDVILVNPEPRDDISVGNVYLVWVHGWDVAADPALPIEEQSANYTMMVWVADGADSSTRVFGSRRAVEGRFNNITLYTRGLSPDFLYMGGITFFNDEGEAQGTTVIEAVLPE